MENEDEKKEDFKISAEIRHTDGSKSSRKNNSNPDGTLEKATGSEALNAFATFFGAFWGAYKRELEKKSEEEKRGDIEEIEFNLSNEKGVVATETIKKEEMEKKAKENSDRT